MRKYLEKLDVIDENDVIIGQDTRENIHKNGLLHREIWVWIFDDDHDILFQKRSADKDTFPNKLDASVGGHVDRGSDYEETALKELEEETGIKTDKKRLIFLGKIRSTSKDMERKITNNVIRAVFAYKYRGETLKIEKGKATSLEFWPMKKLFELSEEEKKQFVPFDWNTKVYPYLKKIAEMN